MKYLNSLYKNWQHSYNRYEVPLICFYKLEGLAPYKAKLLAPAEGWWPLATEWGPFGPLNGGPSGPMDK